MFRPENFVDLDDTCKQYKKRFRQRLAKAWDEAARVTQPYKYDDKLNKIGSITNLPTSTGSVLRFGQGIVRDKVLQEVNQIRMKELLQQSHFGRRRHRSQVRGIKDGAI